MPFERWGNWRLSAPGILICWGKEKTEPNVNVRRENSELQIELHFMGTYRARPFANSMPGHTFSFSPVFVNQVEMPCWKRCRTDCRLLWPIVAVQATLLPQIAESY